MDTGHGAYPFPSGLQKYLFISDEIEHLVIEIDDYQIKEYTKKNIEMKPESTDAACCQALVTPDQDSLPAPSENLSGDEPFSFTCGNPDAQIIHGTMHFFNDLSKRKFYSYI